ncbi:MAG: SCO family protein [Pseudomonadota bacterium]
MSLLSACSKTAQPVRATVFQSALALPAFSLTDQNGNRLGRDELRGQWSAIFFGFTHCPDICPVTLQQLAVARKRMSETLDEEELPAIVFVSVDPERDDAQALSDYVSAFGRGVVGATAALNELDMLTKPLGIFHARPPNPEGGYNVDHSAAIVVINPQAEYHAVFSAPHDIDSLIHDLTLMVTSW